MMEESRCIVTGVYGGRDGRCQAVQRLSLCCRLVGYGMEGYVRV